eukprot:238029-Chlamydomonas_euryale.AAC.9
MEAALETAAWVRFGQQATSRLQKLPQCIACVIAIAATSTLACWPMCKKGRLEKHTTQQPRLGCVVQKTMLFGALAKPSCTSFDVSWSTSSSGNSTVIQASVGQKGSAAQYGLTTTPMLIRINVIMLVVTRYEQRRSTDTRGPQRFCIGNMMYNRRLEGLSTTGLLSWTRHGCGLSATGLSAHHFS